MNIILSILLLPHIMYQGRQGDCIGVLLHSRDLAHEDTGSGTQLGKEDKETSNKNNLPVFSTQNN